MFPRSGTAERLVSLLGFGVARLFGLERPDLLSDEGQPARDFIRLQAGDARRVPHGIRQHRAGGRIDEGQELFFHCARQGRQ